MDAHLILVVDQGVIIKRGTHEELLQRGGKYFELWTKQTEGRRSKPGSVLISTQPDDAGMGLEGQGRFLSPINSSKQSYS
jgi:hypothetical protein